MANQSSGEALALRELGERAGMVDPTVYVVDDEPAVSRYMQRLIESSGHRAETFSSALAFLRHQRTEGPGCLVLDMCMAELDGLELQQRLGDQGDLLPIIFVTGYGSIRTSVQAMKSGAVDFLAKPVDGAEFLAAIEGALERSRQEWARSRRAEILRRRFSALTPREAEVIQRVAQGTLNKQIAVALSVVEKTVKVHRSRAMQKLGIRSAAELVHLLSEMNPTGLPPLPPEERAGTPA